MPHNFSKKWDEEERDRDGREKLKEFDFSLFKSEVEDFKKMTIGKKEREIICVSLGNALDTDLQNEDFRRYLTVLRPIIAKTDAVMTLTNDTNTFFACYLVKTQLKLIQELYESQREEFYTNNSEHIDEFKKRLQRYLETLERHFYDKNFTGVVDSTKDFVYFVSVAVPQDVIDDALHRVIISDNSINSYFI